MLATIGTIARCNAGSDGAVAVTRVMLFFHFAHQAINYR